MSFEVQEIRETDQSGVVDVIITDDYGHERVLRVSSDSVNEVEQGMLIPVSDELEAFARSALVPVQPPPPSSVMDFGSGDATVTPFHAEAISEGRISRPHFGTGKAKVSPDPTETQRVPLDELMDHLDDD